jgi:hypothetical protein
MTWPKEQNILIFFSLDVLVTLFFVLSVSLKGLCAYGVGRLRVDMATITIRSCNHYCSGKAVIVTYSECVFLALGIQHAMRMRRVVICGQPGTTVFFHIILINSTIFEEKVMEYNVCFDFLCKFCLKYFLF